MEKIKNTTEKKESKVELPDELGFGSLMTNRCFEMDYSPDKGWHNPVIKDYEKLSLSPATMFIHYGQSIFEGLKAFKTVEGDSVIFRPLDHLTRLNKSARRMCMPEIDTEFAMEALTELINLEKDWIPENEGQSLYIRPFMFGSDPFLGLKPAKNFKFMIILSPVGAYYPEGFKPVKILAQDDYVRAVRKGVGEAKTSGNYAASLLASEEARKKGYTQVLWLDALEQKYIEEVGSMNIFIRFKDEVATPKLTGSILPGITRDSVIKILKEKNIKITERSISINEVTEEYKKGNVLEVFGSGTAAVISSVGWLSYKDFNMTFNNGNAGELALELFDEITGIHYGKVEDKHNWLTYPDKKEAAV